MMAFASLYGYLFSIYVLKNRDIYKLSSIYAVSAREFGLNVGEGFLVMSVFKHSDSFL